MPQKSTRTRVQIMIGIINKIQKDINGFNGEVVAIEMTPRFHLDLVSDLVSNGHSSHECNAEILGLAIIFIHGENKEYKLLNKDQRKLRQRHNELLKTYSDKFDKLQNIINGSYRIKNLESTEKNSLTDMSMLVKRLEEIEKQMAFF